mgnify:CR=1 FL=1
MSTGLLTAAAAGRNALSAALVPAVNSAAACYTLPLIEQPSGVYYTPAWPEALISFIQWDYPGNPYRDNRALKFRAFMSAASNMMMFHDFAEQNDGIPDPRLVARRP